MRPWASFTCYLLLSVLLASCGMGDSRTSRVDSELERILVPGDASQPTADGWTVGAWSAEAAYAFDTRLTEGEYARWAAGKLAGTWHQCDPCSPHLVFTRILENEQQEVDIQFGQADSTDRIRVRLTFRVTPT